MKAPERNSWPRNVRKLQDLIERSIILSTSAVLGGLLLELPHPRPDTQSGRRHPCPSRCWMVDFAHSSDAPRNEVCDRWSERRCGLAEPGERFWIT